MEDYQVLEKRWAEWNDLDPNGMVVCSSGTAAVHLALESMRLPPNSEVILGDLSMIACARAVTMSALHPVFVDCRDNLNADPGMMREACDTKTSAIMLVHIYGRRASFGGSLGWPVPNRISLVEDLAEAHGVKPYPETDAAAWSFFKNKIISGGSEGGAVWFRDPEHAALARQLRCLGFTDEHDFRHVPRGHNYRMSNVHANLILDGLERAGRWEIPWRLAAVRDWYDPLCPPEWRMPKRDAPWVYDLRIPGMTSDQQDKVVAALRQAGIAARHCFKPMHVQEEYAGCRRVGGENAERLSREVIYLPVQPGVTKMEDCRRAFEILKDHIGMLS